MFFAVLEGIREVCKTITAVCNLLLTPEGQEWLKELRVNREAFLKWVQAHPISWPAGAAFFNNLGKAILASSQDWLKEGKKED